MKRALAELKRGQLCDIQVLIIQMPTSTIEFAQVITMLVLEYSDEKGSRAGLLSLHLYHPFVTFHSSVLVTNLQASMLIPTRSS